jgi:nicotinamidase-related amidase
MPKSAVLLLDLQRDFLGADGARMPVDAAGAEAVLRAANRVLSRKALADALVILVLNQFPASARLGNFFRRGAAIAGSAGAELDARVHDHASVTRIAKSRPSAFSNPELDACLRAHQVEQLHVLGVFAEGCVRATVLDALERGYAVQVFVDAVASDAAWKKRFALWAMKRAGATIVAGLPVD